MSLCKRLSAERTGYRPQRSCGQGYVFTRVCDSVHGGGGCCAIPACIAGGIPACLAAGLQGGACSQGWVCLLRGGGCLLPGGCVCSQGGVSAPRGSTLGGICSQGVSAPGGCLLLGGVSALGGVPGPGGCGLLLWPSGLVAFWSGTVAK